MTDGKKTIQVTEEEFEYLIKLRQELQRRETTGEETPEPLGGSKSSEFAMGTVAGIAAYWLYKELLDDDEEFDDDEPIEVVKEIRPIAVVKKDPRRRYRQ